MSIDLDEMERLAKAAGADPWVFEHVKFPGFVAMYISDGTANRADEPDEEAGQHIVSAQPRNVLELIERVRKAEAEAERWRETATAAFAKAESLTVPERVRLVRHKKRGSTYRVLGTALLQSSEPVGESCAMVVYRDIGTGHLWVRQEVEFDDGRFEEA